MTVGILMLSMLLWAPLEKVPHPTQSGSQLTRSQGSSSPDFVAPEISGVRPSGDFDLAKSWAVPASWPGHSLTIDSEQPPNVCYKIRAFIFKRDDDRVPELLRSTTCGPGQPKALDAILPANRDAGER